MLGRLILLFISVPFVELILLLWLADATHWTWALGLVVFTGVVGAVLAKSQGILVWHRVQQQLRAGEVPTDALMDAAMILVAGALLLTPGLLTDCFGFSLLIPATRRFYRGRLRAFFRERVRMTKVHFGGDREGSRVVDAEVLSNPTSADAENCGTSGRAPR